MKRRIFFLFTLKSKKHFFFQEKKYLKKEKSLLKQINKRNKILLLHQSLISNIGQTSSTTLLIQYSGFFIFNALHQKEFTTEKLLSKVIIKC